jgi:Raf kinase inhibitor-like YbhB/YbcL family protein
MPRNRRKAAPAWLALIILSVIIVGCRPGIPEGTPEGEAEMAIQLTSTAFTEGSTIPKQYTCDGKNLSPQLAWTGLPQGTQTLVLIVDDPDAPGRTFVHWVLYDIPGNTIGLSEGVQGIGVTGTNDSRRTSYSGPCPPSGPAHRYYFKLYALDQALKLAPGATKADVEKTMKGHILSWGQLMGKYGR